MFGRKSQPLVEVNFRDLAAAPNLQPGAGYVYVWGLKQAPAVGMWVWVPGMDGSATAVVCAIDAAAPKGYARSELKAVERVVTDKEIEKARAKWLAERNAWADLVRRAAGLPTAARPRLRAPEGFPAIPPVPGHGRKPDADKHGKGWWAIYNRAKREGWGADEIEHYKGIAEQWFAIRDGK